MPSNRPATPLTPFQLEVAAAFFSLASARGFLIAGGAALAAQGLTARPTQDLDFFTSRGRGDVRSARDDLIGAARGNGWIVETLRDESTFCRLRISGPDELLVDLAVDSPPGRRPMASIAGPTFAPAELAGQKMIALFGRAAARDFVDVHALSRRFSKADLLALAAEVDQGFDRPVFIEMIGMLSRYSDRDLSLGDVDVPALRAFFAAWAREFGSPAS